jgi:hypothetical protein
MAKVLNDIALDRENKLKQALAEGYDFVAIENTYDNENINICYHFFKGEVPKANRFKEIYNLVLFRDEKNKNRQRKCNADRC